MGKSLLLCFSFSPSLLFPLSLSFAPGGSRTGKEKGGKRRERREMVETTDGEIAFGASEEEEERERKEEEDGWTGIRQIARYIYTRETHTCSSSKK